MSFIDQTSRDSMGSRIIEPSFNCENCTNSGSKIVFECFSEIEKSVISWYISKVEALIMTRAPRLNIPGHIWYITNVPNENPDSIIVNGRTMNLLMEGYKFQNSNIISSAFHYFFKGYLRNYLKKYKSQVELNKLYKKYWGYDYKPIKANGKIGMGYVVNLKFHGNQKDYHPTLTNSPKGPLSGAGFQPTLIELISRGNECYEVTKVIRAIDSAECLISRFNGLYAPTTSSGGGASSPYSGYGVNFNEIVDPNKIFVTMISEYVISNYRYIGDNPASPDIFNAIDNLIGHDCLSNIGQLAYPLS